MCLFTYERMFTIGESQAISNSDDTEQQAKTSGRKSSIFNRNSSGERRLKFIASGEDDRLTTRSRAQSTENIA